MAKKKGVSVKKVGKLGYYAVDAPSLHKKPVIVKGKRAANEVAGANRRVILKRAQRRRS